MSDQPDDCNKIAMHVAIVRVIAMDAAIAIDITIAGIETTTIAMLVVAT